MSRLATGSRRVTWLERIRFHRDVAAVRGNGREFHCERLVPARIMTRGCDLSKCFASSFQHRAPIDGDVLS